LPSLTYGEIVGPAPVEGSTEIRKRVEAARILQRERFDREVAKGGPRVRCNALMPAAALRVHCVLDGAGRALLRDAMTSLGLSARAFDRILKVARTVADLEGSRHIRDEHVAEAIHYRTLDRQHLPQY
jgi:magnesium chelatase family protein